jgi:hypothetical protein
MPGVWEELPPLPEIGHPESYYAHQIHRADRLGNRHAREAFKAAQYVTLAMDPRLKWEQKLRYFSHALRAHCTAPPLAPESVWMFYGRLADLVRTQAGTEALRLAGREDDSWASQLQRGVSRDQLRLEAAMFFRRLVGEDGKKPEYLNSEDWEQLRILRQTWIR